ncbi:MAG: 4'-phosphopantetheinyl transferase superfamily protein [Pseudomonadota bacterium]
MTGRPHRRLQVFSEEPLELREGEVHVAYVRLNALEEHTEALGSLLSEEERARARTFRFEKDRRRFVVSRGVLRRLLAAYSSLPPEDIRLTCGPFGKPECVPSPAGGGFGLQFNLSHSHELVAYAFAADRKVGIDIEATNRGESLDGLLSLVFSAEEQAVLAQTPCHQRPLAQLDGWVRKEAYLKGVGIGLLQSLTTFRVPLGPLNGPAPVRSVNEEKPCSWWLYPVDPMEGYATALAVEGEPPVRVSRLDGASLWDRLI